MLHLPTSGTLGQGRTKQIATVDHADMRGLVTDLTSLRRGACLFLGAGIIRRERPWGLSLANAGLARPRVLHTGWPCPDSKCL